MTSAGLVSGAGFGWETGDITSGDSAGMGYGAAVATGACLAGYASSKGETGNGSAGYDGEYNLKEYAFYKDGVYGFHDVVQCYPIRYSIRFDCMSGVTMKFDDSLSGADGIDCVSGNFGSSSCEAYLEFKGSGTVNVTCSREGYKFNGWTYTVDD